LLMGILIEFTVLRNIFTILLRIMIVVE